MWGIVPLGVMLVGATCQFWSHGACWGRGSGSWRRV